MGERKTGEIANFVGKNKNKNKVETRNGKANGKNGVHSGKLKYSQVFKLEFLPLPEFALSRAY